MENNRRVSDKGPGSILFITQWHYDDALVQTYTLPYVNMIEKITGATAYLVTVGKGNNKTSVKKHKGLIVIELPDPTLSGRLQWLLNVRILAGIVKRRDIPVIHAWCTPAGALGVLLKKRNKKVKLIIDSFEPHAEAMAENKTWSRGGLKYRVLSRFEKMEAKRADKLIFAAPGMDAYILKRYGIKIKDYYVKPACVDLNAFNKAAIKDEYLLAQLALEGKTVCVYAGKFGGIYLEDEVFAFIKECETYWGTEKFRFLLLSNVTDEYVLQKLTTYYIQPTTIVKRFVPHNEVHKYIGLGDFAISPVKPVPTKKYCSPIKDAEYWALGLPVVIPPNISADSDIIKENNAGAILEGFTQEAYLKAIKHIDAIIAGKDRQEIYKSIRPLAEKYRNFSIAEKIYSSIYSS